MEQPRFIETAKGQAIPPPDTWCPFTYQCHWDGLPEEALALVGKEEVEDGNLHYGGVRWAKRKSVAHPETLFDSYHTSSASVRVLVEAGYFPSRLEIMEIFGSTEAAQEGEDAMLEECNAAHDPSWLNKRAGLTCQRGDCQAHMGEPDRQPQRGPLRQALQVRRSCVAGLSERVGIPRPFLVRKGIQRRGDRAEDSGARSAEPALHPRRGDVQEPRHRREGAAASPTE